MSKRQGCSITRLLGAADETRLVEERPDCFEIYQDAEVVVMQRHRVYVGDLESLIELRDQLSAVIERRLERERRASA